MDTLLYFRDLPPFFALTEITVANKHITSFISYSMLTKNFFLILYVK